MFATILLPNFYLQAITRHQPALRDHPLAVLDETASKAMILQLNEAAEAVGVLQGMAPSQALARCLHLVIKARAREREQQVSEILLHHAFMLSPFVEATGPGICTIEFKQPNTPGEKLQRTVELLERCDLVARAGIAENPDTSLLGAHLAQSVLPIEQAKEFLAPLPIETLIVATACEPWPRLIETRLQCGRFSRRRSSDNGFAILLSPDPLHPPCRRGDRPQQLYPVPAA